MSDSDQPGRQSRARILFVDHGDVIGGAQLSLAEHVRSLDRRRFEPVVACGGGESAAMYGVAGAEVMPLALPRLRTVDPRLPFRVAAAASGLRRLVTRARAEIVVASTSRAAYTAALALASTGVPLVWWVRDFMYGRRVFSALAARANHIICVSEALRRFYGGENDPRFSVIVVGSTLHRALEHITPEMVRSERARWGILPDDFLIGFMGRLVEEKGPEDVIEAVAQLHRRTDRVRLLLVGTGHGQLNSVEERLRARVAENGWSFVRFAGFQDDEALFYSMFDVVVLASRAHEGYGMSAVQGMMAGTPVVATSVGGTPELVRDRETGLLVPPESPRSIAAAIEQLLREPGLRQQIVTRAREHVMANNREEVTTGRAEAIYSSILSRR